MMAPGRGKVEHRHVLQRNRGDEVQGKQSTRNARKIKIINDGECVAASPPGRDIDAPFGCSFGSRDGESTSVKSHYVGEKLRMNHKKTEHRLWGAIDKRM